MKKNLLLLAVIFCSATLMAQTVSRFAGVYKTSGLQFISPSQSFSTAWFYGTGKIVFDKNGNGWVLETTGNRVRMIDAGLASVYNRAGSSAGNSGAKNDPAGSNALFSNPTDIVINNTSGNIYVADAGNNCIRKISAFATLGNVQTVTTYAGVMSPTGNGIVNGASATAKFDRPSGLAIDLFGNIYVADFNNHCIRKISYLDSSVTVLAGSGFAGFTDSVGIYASFRNPTGLCWYSNYELLVTDMGNSKIRKINVLTQRVSTIAGNGTAGNDDGDALTQATFFNPSGIVLDTNQNIYVTDAYTNVIRKITGSCVSTFAGSIVNAGNAPATDTANGVGATARFNSPTGISSYKGALYVADNGNNSIRKVSIPGTARDNVPVANFSIQTEGNPNKTYSLIDSTTGNIFTGNQRWKITPGSYTYVGGTDSTSAIAQVQFKSMTQYTITLTDANCWGKSSKIATITISNTGVNEVNADKYISVYPNPTNGIFEISINTIEANTIRVMDINGKIILERKNVSSKESIDMTGFAKGVYILTISGTDFSLNKKLIIE